MTDDRLPAEQLSPLATLVDEVLAGVGYDMAAATEAIDSVQDEDKNHPATTP